MHTHAPVNGLKTKTTGFHDMQLASPPELDWERVARNMLISRMMDELEEQELTPQGKVKYQFSARGHELGQSVMAQLLTRTHDAAAIYYRQRPFVLGVGSSVEELFTNGMALSGSWSGGRDVGVISMIPHKAAPLFLPMAGDIGAQFSPAAGAAQALVYRARHLHEAVAEGCIVAVFGGDGAVASNGFWAGLNIATAHRLPVLFVIEDNGYAISVRHNEQYPGGNVAQNLASYANLHILDGDGTDPRETPALVNEAVEHVRRWEGPALLRLSVPRLSGHSSMDVQAYKTKEEIAAEWARDPIPRVKDFLVPARMTQTQWDGLLAEAKQAVADGRRAAENHPLPNRDEVTRFVFSDPHKTQVVGGLAADGISLPKGTDTPHVTDERRLNFIDAIRRTLDVELGVNERLVIFGEDVGAKGGVHAATLGLMNKHGDMRVFDTSLNEEGIIGRAVGMATAGLMPVPEIQFRKYADPAHEHLMNTGTIRWRSNGNVAAPMVVRMPGGFRKLGDPWHSMTNEMAYAHAVGWQIAFPSNAEDAVGLLRTALRGNDPVIFFEHRYLYDAAWARRPYPGDEYTLPFGRARIVQPGDALTVVAWGAMLELVETAAREIGESIEIIDLRTIVPWDKPAVLESVRKTGKCLIVHEDVEFGGMGAEIAATLAKEAFFDLDAPIERVAAPQTLVPFSQHLMAGVIPTLEKVKTAMAQLLKI
ncbi:MAG TPA: thiamine pyrophosphate-dependent enzyme [Thermoflexales bacterium]|nr:thiamine pyrophosphate-dependent enzyme [Thermoflexales bacterium]